MAQKPIFVPAERKALAGLPNGTFISLPDETYDDIREISHQVRDGSRIVVMFADGSSKPFPSFAQVMTFTPIY